MKKKYYLVLDTETATLPFANQICDSVEQKRKVAIAKPLVYDIGWVIMDRAGNIVKSENYLVQETFFVPNIFNTAYYKEKRPVYMKLLQEGQIMTANWNDIMAVLLADLRVADITAAYNAQFDFKKAIPFTENYIKHLYSADYNDWEEKQRQACYDILHGDGGHNPDFMEPSFNLRDEEFPIADLWGIACNRLINIDRYRDYCLRNSLLTTSAQFFKSSAETAFQYLMKQHDFSEEHTALNDAMIEAQILAKALKKGKVEAYLKAFPFRELGTTYDYVTNKRPKYKPKLIDALQEYIDNNDGEEKALHSSYWRKVICILDSLTREESENEND